MRFALLAFSAGDGDCCLFACGAMGRKEGLLRAISCFCLSGGDCLTALVLGFFAFGGGGVACAALFVSVLRALAFP
ncbi:hypothetical protein [Paraburkholderia sp. GAS32]|jgi:hypothetical protein|uniref:hypothetical protein n=1 Tax=Paraburkholderia sp. GAS32 TaxID=3035129 RepID=UPI003D22118E